MSYPGNFYGSGHQQVLDSASVHLTIRQQPIQALVALEGKEKCMHAFFSVGNRGAPADQPSARKPIDPPPIVQLDVNHSLDPHKHFLVSPYLFMYAILVPADERKEQNEPFPSAQMLGTLCSSLHRLKDTTNNDGGFFVFGDLSVRKLGTHRLRFALYDVGKIAENAAFITDVLSEPFQVVASKDFHGMEESSYLSRAFSDQGVRLRLRKEPRSIATTHRRNLPQKYSPVEAPTPHHALTPYNQTQRSDHFADNARSLKRQRSDDDYGDSASAFPPAQMLRLAYPTYGTGSTLLAQGYGQIKQEPYERVQSSYGEPGHPNYSVRSATYPASLPGTSGWQTSLQQPGHPTLSVNPTLDHISEHGPIGGSSSLASIPRPTNNYPGNVSASASYGNYGGGYQSQANQPYQSQGQFSAPPSRTSSDSYPAMYGGLQTPTSMTGTAGLPTGHDTGYMPASSGAMPASAGTAGHTPVQSQHYPTDYPSLSSGYTHSSATYDDSSPTHQTAPQPHQSAGQLSYTSTIASSSLPANSMLLGQGLPDNFYPQDEASYPTPTHTKPSNQWG